MAAPSGIHSLEQALDTCFPAPVVRILTGLPPFIPVLVVEIEYESGV